MALVLFCETGIMKKARDRHFPLRGAERKEWEALF